jgi:hypothetical protein
VKPTDPSEPDDQSFDATCAWIVFRRRLRRRMLEESRRQLRSPDTPSRRVVVDETILTPSSTHESRN